MTKKRLYAHVVLDRSGSMEPVRDKTIDAFNEYVHSLAIGDISTRISLTIFDAISVDLVFDNVKAADAPKLTRDTYVPRGGTPLFDAIGKTVAKIDTETRREGENVALVILTDGQENSSHEYTAEAIRALLEGRQRDKNWLVVYLGANQDAFATGATLGTQSANTMNFSTANIRNTMRGTAEATARYAASGSTADAAFTDEERASAVGGTGTGTTGGSGGVQPRGSH